MANLVESQGAKIIGTTSTDGYTFEKSRGVKNGIFVGLMIDVENQDDLTEERIQ